MKCTDCRKKPEHLTLKDRISRRIMFILFGKDLNDLFADKYTQGFSDGFVKGSESAMEMSKKYFDQIIKR